MTKNQISLKSKAPAKKKVAPKRKKVASGVKKTKKESMLKQAIKASNPFAIKRKINFAVEHPEVILNPTSMLKKDVKPAKKKAAPKRKKFAPGVKKTGPKMKTVKTASTKAAAVSKSMTILQRNVKNLLSEFKKKDSLDVKITKAAKSLRAKRKK